MTNKTLSFFILSLSLVALFLALLTLGEVDISLTDFFSGLDPLKKQVFWDFRIPKGLTALGAGGGLAVSGLLLQAFFNNPLAGPFVLGVHSASAMGIMLWLIIGNTFFGDVDLAGLGTVLASSLGAVSALLLLLVISWRVSSKSFLLIIGLLISYLVSGVINFIIPIVRIEKIKAYLMWSLGSFQRVYQVDLIIFLIMLVLGLVFSAILIKPLNALSLGEAYAQTLGASLKRTKFLVLIVAAVLTALVTSFCGPIAFIGLMAPHMARAIFRTGNHQILLPASFICGGSLALLAEIMSQNFPGMPEGVSIPINALLSLLGAPALFILLIKLPKGERL